MVQVETDQAGRSAAGLEYPRFPPLCHPLDQAGLWLPYPLYSWQIKDAMAFAEPFCRVVVSTCNESGKTSSLGPLFLLSWMAAFPGCRAFATSASERQVMQQLLDANILPIIRHWPDTWKFAKSEGKITHANGSSCLFYVCDDPNNVEGFHSKWARGPDGKMRFEPCVYLIDEAKGVKEEVHNRVRRINPYAMLAMSSPGELNSWHARAIDPDHYEDCKL